MLLNCSIVRAETKASSQRGFKLSLRSGIRGHKKVGVAKPVAAAAADTTDNATNQRTAVQPAENKFEEKVRNKIRIIVRP